MPHLASRRALIAAVFAALASAASASAWATLYKWVDEKGVTHYTQEPPPDGKATKIEPRVDAPASKPQAPENWKEREIEFRRRRLEKERNEENAKAGAQNAEAQRHARCIEAREELQILSPGHPVYQVNEKGERVYLEDAQREAQTRRWQAQADKWCEDAR
jgi:hypothetical protein